MKFLKWTSSVVLAVALYSCNGQAEERLKSLEELTDQVINEHVSDKRLAVAEPVLKLEEGKLVLLGKTDMPEVKEAVLKALSEKGEVIDRMELLPEAELGDNHFAVVNISVANMRVRGSHSAGMAKQATMGEVLKVLEKEGSWYRVQTTDHYIGWISNGSIELATSEAKQSWDSRPKVIYTKPTGFVYENTFDKEKTVSDIVYGNLLALKETQTHRYKVEFPDGREGFVLKSEAMPIEEWKQTRVLTQENLVNTAKTYLGLPYNWGGNSYKGVDCSGFTGGVYFANGLLLPRDASQQVRIGDEIDTLNNFANLQDGDLLFFGRGATDSTTEKVTHVGMWIGNQSFIHSSGHVRISSVDSTAENYDEYNLNRLLHVKRVLGSKNLKETIDLKISKAL
ncbi:C40 family peptidase [Limibacter armeniacum]|uniref:C40 family peptidase n=1 Tax=Limibacter armeniacum TaxID=466084 RepID=UPI002FE5056D